MLPAPTHGHPPGSLQARLAAAASGRVAGGGARPAQPQHHPQQHHDQGPSAALLDKVRALDALPRIGSLKTLDLKGNDIRVRFVGFQFITTYGFSFFLTERSDVHCAGSEAEQNTEGVELE